MTTMDRSRLRPLVAGGRRGLRRLAVASPALRQAMERVGEELTAAALDAWDEADFYGARYYGHRRDPSGDRGGLSGYATYDRISSNADIAGYVVWRNFGGARRVLDVGCARGFLVEVLCELGVDAEGCDVSAYAVAHPTGGARGRLRVADPARGLPWADGSFEVVTCLETLEHLSPEQVPGVVRELRRVSRGAVYATIPSLGVNESGGPDGHFEGKVRPERLAHYEQLGPDYDGPVPTEDLARDAEGKPVEGHLTIASFRWWTQVFADAGMTRRLDVERRIHADIAPVGLGRYWNLYVFAAPGADETLFEPRCADRSLVELGLEHPLFAQAGV